MSRLRSEDVVWVSNFRTLVTLDDLVRLKLKIRQCRDAECSRHRRPYRPEAEGALALPHHEFGLDIIALIGALRYVQHQSVPEIHRALRERGVDIAERSVTHLLERYDELLALSLSDADRLREITAREGRVILALDGLQPDVGHEVLWVLRDCPSGEVLLAKSLLSSAAQDLGALLKEVASVLRVPIEGVVSDGQQSIRRAVERALPGVPHQLCHFHYLREAALPVYEADRHAKKVLKKRVRGIRVIERKVEPRGELPRTNNDLEQFFGSSRHHERRTTGRKRAPLGLVLRGSVRLVAGAATRLRSRNGAELQPCDPAQWKQLRQQLNARCNIRRQGLRFRRDPKAYLENLEERMGKLILPS